MDDRDYIKVTVSKESLVVTLVGFWYKEKNVLERVGEICKAIPITLLSADWHDETLGAIIMDNGELEQEFVDFTLESEFGKFCHNIVGSHIFDLYGRTRIALDLGRHVKTTNWWADNLKEMKSIKAKLKTIRDIQDD